MTAKKKVKQEGGGGVAVTKARNLGGGEKKVLSEDTHKETVRGPEEGLIDDDVRVGIRLGQRINLGNYEHFDVSVWVDLPSSRDIKKMERTAKAGRSWCVRRLEDIVNSIVGDEKDDGG